VIQRNAASLGVEFEAALKNSARRKSFGFHRLREQVHIVAELFKACALDFSANHPMNGFMMYCAKPIVIMDSIVDAKFVLDIER
jgi:hypothetical protein